MTNRDTYRQLSFTDLKWLLDKFECDVNRTFEITKRLSDTVGGMQPSIVYDVEVANRKD